MTFRPTFAGIPYLHLPMDVTRDYQVPTGIVVDAEHDDIVSFKMFLCDTLDAVKVLSQIK